MLMPEPFCYFREMPCSCPRMEGIYQLSAVVRHFLSPFVVVLHRHSSHCFPRVKICYRKLVLFPLNMQHFPCQGMASAALLFKIRDACWLGSFLFLKINSILSRFCCCFYYYFQKEKLFSNSHQSQVKSCCSNCSWSG